MLITTIVLSAFNFPSTTNAAIKEASWTSMAPMPTARGGLGVAVLNGKIYAIGGFNGDLSLNTNEEYNPVTNQWDTKTPMPTARSGFAIAVYGGKIYAIGGTVGNGYVANNEAYDPITNTWETKASMPTPRADLCANIVNDKIYLIGGKKYSSTTPFYGETNINEVYDPATDTWTTKTPIPTAVLGYASAVVNDKIYVIGGSPQPISLGSTIMVDLNQVYDTQTDKWSTVAQLPSVASYGAAGATVGFMAPAQINYIGGFSANAFSGKTQIYNPEKNSWSQGDLMPTPREYLGIAVVSDVLYAIGGFDGEKWLDTNEQYKPVGYGTVAPKVRITSPENKTYSEVSLAFTVNRGTEWMGYSLDNQVNITLKAETKLSGLSQGPHNITIYANDSLGNMGSSNTVFFSIDTLAPNIVIMIPQNQTYDATDIQLTFTVNENVTYLAYSLDDQEKVTIIGNVTLPALSDGSHLLTVFATDETGNSGSETVYFNIASFPIITVAAATATITIALAAGYLFFKRRKSNDKEE
jgi:N-acetylneuraminic acid mutarotase